MLIHFRSKIILAVFFLLLAASSLSAQINLGNLYDLDAFSSERPTQAPRNHVTITGSFAGKYLLLTAKMAKDWHIYSVTQPDGGTIRSTFKFESPDLTPLPALLEIRPTIAPEVDDKAVGFNVDIESHDDTVTWIFTFTDELPKDRIITGTFDGLVCQAGEGGTCIPVTLSFEAAFDPNFDVTPHLAAAQKVPDRFIFRTNSKTEPPVNSSLESVTEFAPQEIVPVTKFSTAILYAFLGGIILNFMPCVLPVIGLKILSFFEQAGKSRARAFFLNVCYSAGLLTVFLFLAFLSLGLSILFTFDLFNIVMACVVFAMALSLMGIWELSVPGFLGGGTSDKLMRQEGVFGAFFKGIITTLLAIPCGAPLLSPAVNWADMQIRSGNTPLVFFMYGMIALGMASPYLIIGAFPELLRFLPKPGQWMETFKKVMGFCLLIAVVWILFFVRLEKLLPTVALLFALWFACWLVGRNQYETTSRNGKFANIFVAIIIVAVVLLFSFQIPGITKLYTIESAMLNRLHGGQSEHWQPYTSAAFEAALASGKPVAVDFTADWCVNCKVLEATVLESKPILQLLDEKHIVTLTADCTRKGEATEFLKKLGPEQVPVLAIFDPKTPMQPTVLRGFYTQKKLIELLTALFGRCGQHQPNSALQGNAANSEPAKN